MQRMSIVVIGRIFEGEKDFVMDAIEKIIKPILEAKPEDLRIVYENKFMDFISFSMHSLLQNPEEFEKIKRDLDEIINNLPEYERKIRILASDLLKEEEISKVLDSLRIFVGASKWMVTDFIKLLLKDEESVMNYMQEILSLQRCLMYLGFTLTIVLYSLKLREKKYLFNTRILLSMLEDHAKKSDEYMETVLILLDEKLMKALSRVEEDLKKGRFREVYV